MIKDILLHVSRSYTPYIPLTEYIAVGQSQYGALNDNRAIGLYQKVNYTGSIVNINDVAAGRNAYFIAGDGTLWGWGDSGFNIGKGITDEVMYSSPVQIGTETNWLQVTTEWNGNHSTLAIKSNGTLWAWGENTFGQLGLNDIVTRYSPIQVGNRNVWSKVKTNNLTTFALTSTGELWGWGDNTNGKLALSNTSNRSSPVQIGKEIWNDLSLNVLDFDIGDGHVVAVVQNPFDTTNLRDLWGWGLNTSGQLGLNDVVSRSSPVQIAGADLFPGDPSFKKVACGASHTIALMEESPGSPNSLHRSLWGWGSNGSGRLGLNDTVNRSSPVQIGTRTDWDRPYANGDVTFVIAHNSDYGDGLFTPGELWGWGPMTPSEEPYGIQFQGFGLGITRSTPTQITIPNKEWRKLYLDRSRSVAIVEPGEAYSAGWGVGGEDFASRKRGNDVFTLVSPTELVFNNDYSGSKTWSKIDSFRHSVAIDSNGKLYTWGINEYGQLGTDNIIAYASPIQLGSDNWIDAKVTFDATFAIKSDGTLWAWGRNANGMLGLNDTVNRSSPVQIGSETNWSKLPNKLGQYVAAAIKTNDTLWMWGVGTSGNLGDGGAVSRSVPVVVGASTAWNKVSVSESHTIAVRTNGTIWAWGRNTEGQLSTGESSQRNSPVQIGTETNWVDAHAVRFGSYGLKSDKSLWAWGSPENVHHGRWVNPTFFTYVYEENIANPSYVSAAIGVGVGFLLKSDGTLWSWGRSTNGNLGTREIGPRSNLAQIPSNITWESVAAGNFNTVLQTVTTDTGVFTTAIKTNGTLWGWGSNNNNQIGISSTTQHRSSPVQIGTETNWSGGKLVAGNASGYIIRSDGTLWSWGLNGAGQLGIGSTANRSRPTQVGNRSNWSLIGAFHQHVGAINTSGELFMWGLNDFNQLGTNDGTSRISPVQIGTETNWSKVQPGYRFTMAIKTDGTLWGWGDQSLSQIGNGVTSTRISSPVQIGTETNWSKLGVNSASGYGIKTDGTLWGWGAVPGVGGYWGDGTTVHRSSPSQIGTETNYVDIFSGQSSLLFMKTNNRIMQNGSGGGGGVGYIRFMPANTTIARSSPIIVGQYTSIDAIYSGNSSANYFHLVTKRPDNTLYYFGSNIEGQSGEGVSGASVGRSSPVQLSYDSYADDVFVGGESIIIKKTY